MTLIVEDGSGVAGADSYVSLAAADLHFSDLGESDWTDETSGRREAALRRATLYVDSFHYGGRIGSIQQGLRWPRHDAVDDEGRPLQGVPGAIMESVLELALHHVKTALLDAPRDPGSRVRREKIGAIETEYGDGPSRPVFPSVLKRLRAVGAKTAYTETVRA